MKLAQDKKKINIYKNNLKKYIKENIDISKSVLAYGCSWEKNFPTFNIKYLYEKKYFFKLLSYYFIDLIKTSYNEFTIKGPFTKKKNFNSLYLTWGSIKNFKGKNYYCQFYKKNTLDKNVMWIIFLLDVPSNLPKCENIIFFYNKNSKLRLYIFLKLIIKSILKYGLKIKNYLHYFSPYSQTAEKFSNLILPIVKKYNFKKFEIVYEGQPFQNLFIKNIRKISSKKIIGLCPAYQALPMHLMKKNYKKCDPDKLIVHEMSQRKSLVKYFNWNINEIILQKRKINEKFIDTIYLPYSIEDSDYYLTELNFFLSIFKNKLSDYNLPSVKSHPAKKENHNYKKFEKNINNELKKYVKYFSKKKVKQSFILFLGPSSGLVRAINKKNRVFQIFINKNTDIYKKNYWPKLKLKYITYNTLQYEKIN